MSNLNISVFDKWHNEKVLITGGAGFIGSNLARRIVDLGGEVTIVDSLIPQYGGNLFNLTPRQPLFVLPSNKSLKPNLFSSSVNSLSR